MASSWKQGVTELNDPLGKRKAKNDTIAGSMDEHTPNSPQTPPTPFDFIDGRQRLIHERLTRLVGQNAADFYRDACRLMAGSN